MEISRGQVNGCDTIRGSADNVLEAIAADYPEVAAMTREILVAMFVTGNTSLEVTPDIYDKVSPKNIEISYDGHKMTLTILPAEV